MLLLRQHDTTRRDAVPLPLISSPTLRTRSFRVHPCCDCMPAVTHVAARAVLLAVPHSNSPVPRMLSYATIRCFTSDVLMPRHMNSMSHMGGDIPYIHMVCVEWMSGWEIKSGDQIEASVERYPDVDGGAEVISRHRITV